MFIERRKIPAILTSRPDGFRKLQMQMAGWQQAELADFSLNQQREYVTHWFQYRLESDTLSGTAPSEEATRRMQNEVEQFTRNVTRSSVLRELARTPLLLGLLIFQSFTRAAPPTGRAEAYKSLVEHLVREHPRRRKDAAMLVNAPREWTDEEAIEALAFLAHTIHTNAPDGLLQEAEAATILEQYFRHEEIGRGLPISLARPMAKALLLSCEEDIGILVRRSQTEIGFYHRAFQEYLAARHLSRLSLDEAKAEIVPHADDPQWREVILNFMQIVDRPKDGLAFIEALENRCNVSSTLSWLDIQALLYEIAFNAVSCPPAKIKLLVQKAFEAVEQRGWMPYRERVLNIILEGTPSTTVTEMIRERLQRWFSCSYMYKSNIYNAMIDWPNLDEVNDTLWRAIQEEDVDNQRTAALVCANRFKGQSSAADRLHRLAQSADDTTIQAAALLALHHGWPDYPSLAITATNASQSTGVELRIAAIRVKTHLGIQSDADREELLRIGTEYRNVRGEWKDSLLFALIEGWPKSSEIKTVCLNVLAQYSRTPYEWGKFLSDDLALEVLLRGYPQDDDVARYCASQIKANIPLNLFRDVDTWKLLSRNFQQHPELVDTVEEWAIKQNQETTVYGPQVAIAGILAHTDRMRNLLIKGVKEFNGNWCVSALLEGWGMQDQVVNKALTTIVEEVSEEVQQIAPFLPRIITDKQKCHHQLLSLLRDVPGQFGFTFVLQGLEKLGDTQEDTNIVDLLFDLGAFNKRNIFDLTHELLIKNYSSDVRVQNLALQELENPQGPMYSIAHAYGQNSDVRQRLLQKLNALPNRLRSHVATFLKDGYENTYALSLLSQYVHDPTEEVAMNAAISYHERLKSSGHVVDDILPGLISGVQTKGFFFEAQRRVALCGILTWGREDLLQQDPQTARKDRIFVPVGDYSGRIPSSLPSHLAKHWGRVQKVLGKTGGLPSLLTQIPIKC